MRSVLTNSVLAVLLPWTLAGEVNADLLRAARQGDTETVKVLIAEHRAEIADANSALPAVAAAAEEGHIETLLVLLKSPVIDRTEALQRAILLASKAGFIDTVLAVAKLGGPELLDSAMVSAVAFEQTDLARLLIAQGGRARPSERGTASSSTILGLLAAKGATELIEIMVEAGAEPNRVDGEGRYPLTSAARAGRADGVRLLLNVGSEIDATNKDGRTALSHAIEKGWREVVRILLAAGADTERPNSSGQTALLEVAPTSRTSLLSTLLEWKADVNARDTSGRSALMVAAEAGRLDNVRVLLSHEQDLDAKDKEGRTAEDYASVRRRNDIIEAIQVAKRKR
jgi:ankyrin repeat protein